MNVTTDFPEARIEPTTDELRTEIELAQAVRAMCQPGSSEWHDVSNQLEALFEQMRRRTSAAVGRAVTAKLLGVSQRGLDVGAGVGGRFVAEVEKRCLAVLPHAHADVEIEIEEGRT